MRKLEILSISANLNYLFTNEGVIKISSQLKDLKGKNLIPYTTENLDVAIDIFKENVLFKYHSGKIALDECLGLPRKFMYKLLETLEVKNQNSIINEWENKFGNKLLLINESFDKLLVESRFNESFEYFKIIVKEETWFGKTVNKIGSNVGNVLVKGAEWTVDQAKQLQQKGLVGYAADKAKSLFKYVSDGIASAFQCVKSGIECTMEGVRKILFSIIAQVALAATTAIPIVGQVTNGVLFGSLLIWDLYKMASGKYESGPYQWSFMDILMDILGLLLPSAAKIAKTAFVGVKSFAEFGKMAVSKGGIWARVFNVIKTGISKVQGFIAQGAKFLGEKLGIKSLADWGTKASQKVTQLSDEMAQAAKSTQAATSTIKSSVKTLSNAERLEYDKLLNNWKTQQKAMGKNVSPGQGTRDNLIAQAKKNVQTPIKPTAGQQIKQIWSSQSNVMPTTGQLIKTAKGTLVFSVAICAAMGETPRRCGKKIESGEITPEQYAQAEQQYQDQLAQGFEDIQLQGEL